MNFTPHDTIPGLYNLWNGDVYATTRALNLPEGRVWRTKAHRNSGDGTVHHLGDFPTREEAIKAVQAWADAL